MFVKFCPELINLDRIPMGFNLNPTGETSSLIIELGLNELNKGGDIREGGSTSMVCS